MNAFFAALAARDCKALEQSIGGELEARIAKAGCTEALADFERHGTALVRIEEVAVDGRDPDARLVHLVVSGKKGEKRVMSRVEWRDGRWRLTAL